MIAPFVTYCIFAAIYLLVTYGAAILMVCLAIVFGLAAYVMGLVLLAKAQLGERINRGGGF